MNAIGSECKIAISSMLNMRVNKMREILMITAMGDNKKQK